MSWLSSVESLLNKVDQAAGQALHKDGDEPASVGGATRHTTSSTNSSTFRASSSSQWQPPTKLLNDTSSRQHTPFLSNNGNASGAKQSPAGTQVKGSVESANKLSSESGTLKVETEKELFEFLNSDSSMTSGGTTDAAAASRRGEAGSRFSEKSISRPPSTSSNQSRKTPEQLSVATGMASGDIADGGYHFEDGGNGQSSGYQSGMEDGITAGDLAGQRSALELENQLLKGEITSLNQEMQSILHRIQTVQEELSYSQSKLGTQTRQLSQSEQIVRELQSRESDLQEVLGVKDTQLTVLRGRLEETDRELEAKRKRIIELQADRDRILEDQSCSTGMQGHALNTLQDKLSTAESSLYVEQEQHHKSQEEWMARHKTLESDKQGLSAELSSLQRSINKEKVHNSEIATQLKASRGQTEAAKQELLEYKDKAARILQSKDRLIASLKEGSESGTTVSGGDTKILSSELEATRQERDVLRDELQSSQIALDGVRAELSDVENQMQQEAESSRDQICSLEEQLQAEQRKREDFELENNRQKQELRYVHEELLKQKTALQSRIQDRDAEIVRLRTQLTNKAVNATSEEELENRLHSLTESLIQKQTMLEALSTDKSSLVLQLERMEKQYRTSEAAALRASASVANIPEDDEVRQRNINFMNESPYDGNVTRRVKLAANTIDRFSMRLGRFLRQYPIARVFIIIYMGVLHLWVMIVLLTYQPEVHDESSFQKGPHI